MLITEKMFIREFLPVPVLSKMPYYRAIAGKKITRTVIGHGPRKFVEVSLEGIPALLDVKTASIYVNNRCISSDRLELAP